MNKPDPKARLKKLLHVAKRDLGLDEESYRLLLVTATGKRSSTEMTLSQLEQALEAMKKKGFKVRVKAGARPLAQDGQSRKLRQLWLELYGKGVVRNPGESALIAWVKRMTHKEALQWLTPAEASKCIEELKRWTARVEAAHD